MVQFPAGSPEIATEPVAKIQVGAVITPIVGAAGVMGWAGIGTFTERADVQPQVFVKLEVSLQSNSL